MNGKTPAHPRLEKIVQELSEIAAKRPSIVLADHKTAKTGATIGRIIEAAHAVFVRDGHAGLSLRKVADEAEIAVGNLTYHFSTKNDLLHAVLAERLAQYIDDHLTTLTGDPSDPKDLLLDILVFYVRNVRDTHRFFFQMWGYAGASDDARDYVRNLYLPIGRLIFQLVWAANPDLEYEQVRRAVLQIYSLEEGLKVLTGLGPEDDIALAAAEADVRELAQIIVFGPPGKPNGGAHA